MAYSSFGRSAINQRLIIRNMGKTSSESRDILDREREITHNQRLNALKEYKGSSSSDINLKRIPSEEKNSQQQKLTSNSSRIRNGSSIEFKENSPEPLIASKLDFEQRLTSLNEFEGLVPFDLRQIINAVHNTDNKIINSLSKPFDLQKEFEYPIKEISLNHAEATTRINKVECSSKLSMNSRLAAIRKTREKQIFPKNKNVPPITLESDKFALLGNGSLCRPNYQAQQRHLVTKSNPEESINNNDENLLTNNNNPPFALPKDEVNKSEPAKHALDNNNTKSENTTLEPIQIKVDHSRDIQNILQKNEFEGLVPFDLRQIINAVHNTDNKIINSLSKPLDLQKEFEYPIKEISLNHAEATTRINKVECSSKLSMNSRLAAIRKTSEKQILPKNKNVPPITLESDKFALLGNGSLCRPNYQAQQRHLVTKSNPEESINNNDENLLTNNNNTSFALPKDEVNKSEPAKHALDDDNTKSKNTTIEPIQIKVDHPRDIQNILQKYPRPKNTLHNFYQILSEEFKDVSLKCSTIYKYVRLNNKNSAWTCTYRIKWPMNYEISATDKTKMRASALAACKTLELLSEQGKLSPEGTPLIYNREEVTKISKQKQSKVEFDKLTIQNMENIIQVFSDNMLPTINSTNFTDYKEQLSEIVTEESHFLSKEPQFLAAGRYLAKEKIILPISAYKDAFIELLLNNNCVIVKGEPGCGKSTRVPQYVLESWIRGEASSRNQLCRIAVTQPRRIAAISLADRVASERNEEVGDIVGYQVRLKSNFVPRTGRILYCTTGILMRQIQSDPHLTKFSHIILDEAHERDVNTDILMNVLKIALKQNPSLKVVVMSATIDTESFSDYFDGAPILNVPGFSYPIEKFYLDEASLELYPKTLKMCKSDTPQVVHEEVVTLLKYIHRERPEGAILVFLPGWEDLMKVQRLISASRDVVVHLVHSKLKNSDQYKIFSKPPPGVRKIILATNIAETSITIDDVVYVVDTGMHKDNIFDIKKGINVIDLKWISQASANQRAGRAGRCAPGDSYHLYTKDKYEEFEEYSSPKILNSSLTRVVLESKVFSNNMNAGDFMNSLITPPEKAAVQKAVNDLKQLELLDDYEKLTPLGRTLVDFQLEPGLAKAMVNSVVFKCITPIVDIITLFSSETDIFGSNTLIDKKFIKDVKSAYCRSSDHLAMMRVYEQWLQLNEENPSSADRFCRNKNLVPHKLEYVDKLKKIHYGYLQNGLYNVLPLADNFSDNDELVKAVLYSGTGTVLEHRNWDIVKNRLKTNVNVLVTRNNHKASIGQESVNFKRHRFPSNFMVYMNETRSNIRRTTIVRECSLLPAISVLLFNNKDLEMLEPDSGDTISDNMVILGIKNTKLNFLCNKKHASLLLDCKKSIDLSYKYLIHQMTCSGEKNPEMLENWDKILKELDKILLRHKVV